MSTKQDVTGKVPTLGYWFTDVARGERTLAVDSPSEDFERVDSATTPTNDAATWVFRPKIGGTPSAVVVGLRVDGLMGKGGPPSSAVTVSVPARSIAYLAFASRPSAVGGNIHLQIGEQSDIELEPGEDGDFIEAIRNGSQDAVKLRLRVWVVKTTQPAASAYMNMSSSAAAPDVHFITGRLSGGAAAFAGAIIIKPAL